MIFMAPDDSYGEKIKEYRQEFAEYNSFINGMEGLELTPEMGGKVKNATFLYVDEETDMIVGMANIRFGLNAYFFHEGGHVGYSIRPTERGKGYATQLLKEAIAFCRFIGLEKILVVCEKSNIASKRVIEKCGGVLEDEVEGKWQKGIFLRYWI